MLEVSCRLTESDLQRFFSKKSRIRTWASGFIGAAVLFFTVYLLFRFPKQRSVFELVLLVGPCILLGLLALYFALADSHVSARNALKNNPSLRESRYSFLEDGFTLDHSQGHSHTVWAAIVKVVENDDMFLMYLRNGAAFILPKSCFISGAQIREMRDLLRNILQERAHLVEGRTSGEC